MNPINPDLLSTLEGLKPYALRLTKNHYDAADLLQEVCVKALVHSSFCKINSESRNN